MQRTDADVRQDLTITLLAAAVKVSVSIDAITAVLDAFTLPPAVTKEFDEARQLLNTAQHNLIHYANTLSP